jgi:DNA repair protein RecO (recombination protein O)
MIEKATGLVLRVRPLTETSLIVNWLTPGFGRLSTVAKGARRPKSPFKLDLFYLAEFSFQRSRRSELHTLREASVRETHLALRQDVVKLNQACYAALFIEQTTETDTPLEDGYELMREFLKHLEAYPPRAESVFAFELRLLRIQGLEPPLDETDLPPGAKAAAKALLETDWHAVSRIRLSESQAAALQQYLHGYLIYHLGRLPRGRAEAIPRRLTPA